MATIKDILLEQLDTYVTTSATGLTELTTNTDMNLFTLIAIGDNNGNHFTFTALIVRLLPDTIIIEEDRNSKPLYEALLQAGIPREKIILAYAGEKVPNLSSRSL